MKSVLSPLIVLIIGAFSFAAMAQPQTNGDDAENPIPSVEDAYPVPPTAEPFMDGVDVMFDSLESGAVEPQLFIGKKYRYCQVKPVGYNQVACSNCTSRGIGGEGGRAYCGAKCGGACSVRYGRCSESRNRPPCP